MTHNAPDSPGDRSVDEELNDTTRESMERIGREDLDADPGTAGDERDDRETAGQNSDQLPQ